MFGPRAIHWRELVEVAELSLASCQRAEQSNTPRQTLRGADLESYASAIIDRFLRREGNRRGSWDARLWANDSLMADTIYQQHRRPSVHR